MNVMLFVADWALRCAALALMTGIALRASRAAGVSTRLAGWKAALVAGMAMPFLLPVMPPLFHAPAAVKAMTLAPAAMHPAAVSDTPGLDYFALAGALYVMVAFVLLVRLAVGATLARRLVRRAQPTDMPDVLESAEIRVPVTLGVLRPRVVLPPGWQEWDETTLNAVLAHERSHIARGDTLFQFLSAAQAALLWFSPLSWWLHSTLASLAEDASDDEALAASGDAAHYAEMLLHFVRRAPARVLWQGVAMARTSEAERRIDRILSGHALSGGVGRRALVVILGCTLAGSMLVAAAQVAPPPPPPAPRAPVAQTPTAPPPPAPAVPSKPSPVPPPPPGDESMEAPDAPEAPDPPDPPEAPEFDGRTVRSVVQGVINGKLRMVIDNQVESGLAETMARLQALRQLDQLKMMRETEEKLSDVNTQLADQAKLAAMQEAMEARMKAKQLEVERLQRQLKEVQAALDRATQKRQQ